MTNYDFQLATVLDGKLKNETVAVLSEKGICTCEMSNCGDHALIPKSSLRFWRPAQSVTVKNGLLEEVVWVS